MSEPPEAVIRERLQQALSMLDEDPIPWDQLLYLLVDATSRIGEVLVKRLRA